MTHAARFWDRIAERYAQQALPNETVYHTKLDKTRDYLTPDSEVFEFGCGTGATAIAHAPHVKRIRAIDVSHKMLRIARARAESAGVDNVTFAQAAIEDYRLAPASLDVVLGLNSLHLLSARRAVIDTLIAALKPGGVFVTSTPCLGDMSLPVRLLGWISPLPAALGLMPMLRVFTARQLMAELRAAGFRIEHEWQPGKNQAAFIIARKPAGSV